MKLLRIIVIFLSFNIEIKVKALEQNPMNCLDEVLKITDCSLVAIKEAKIKTPNIQLTLNRGSILFRNNEKGWNLVEGGLRVQNKKKIKINTKIGSVQLFPGTYWLKWTEEKLWVVTLNGIAKVTLFSSQLSQNLVPEGFMNWYGLINYKNYNSMGVPRVIELSYVKELFPNFSHFKDRSIATTKVGRTIAQASELYKNTIQMLVDQEKMKAENYNRMIENQIKAESEAQQLFREKHLSPIDFGNSFSERE